MSCILSIETCTSYGSLCLKTKGKTFCGEWSRPGSHSEVITVELQQVLKAAGVTLSDLTAIAVGIGPGSFTGIRIGINLAKSLAYSLKLPIYPFDTLTGIASQASAGEHTLVITLNAFRNLVYTAFYKIQQDGRLDALTPPEALTFEEIFQRIDGPFCAFGTALSGYKNSPADKLKFIDSVTELNPKAQHYFELLESPQLKASSPKDWNQLSPLYVRASEAEEKLKNKFK